MLRLIKLISKINSAFQPEKFKIFRFSTSGESASHHFAPLVIADSRIGRSHTQVPGIDNDRGFGGTCFPKDLNSLVVQMESKNINADILKEVWKYNEEIRKVIDWPVT